MFDQKVLRELATTVATGPILSIYLNVDPLQRNADEYRLTLREMLKQVEHEADSADVEAVKRYLDLEYNWAGRGLVLFSRQAEGLWYAFALSVPVRSGITVAKKPYISPLVELEGLYGRYSVVQVDQQGARFFLFHLGDLIAQEGYMGEGVRRTRKGRGSSMVGMRGGAPTSGRKEAELVQRNMREIAAAAGNFINQHHPRRLLLAGAEHIVAQFQDVLPATLRDNVIATFGADMDANENQIRDQSLQLLQQLEEQRKQELVEAVITAAAKGFNGVIRLDDTLSAAYEGRIQVLVVERDFHQPGYQCVGCSSLTTQAMTNCHFCGKAFTEIPDAAEAVVAQVVEKGGTVEVVDNDAMGEAHIGALLRY